MVATLENNGSTPQLVSVDAELPRTGLLGFEPTCIHKICENRVGALKPGEKKEIRIGIWSNNQTRSGGYPVSVRVYTHYQDYSKVVHSTQRSAMLRVV